MAANAFTYVPLPPLPVSYQTAPEGSTLVPGLSSSSHATRGKSHSTSHPAVLASVETGDTLAPARLDAAGSVHSRAHSRSQSSLHLIAPYPFPPGSTVDANGYIAIPTTYAHPPLPPPPQLDAVRAQTESMAYRHSHAHVHTRRHSESHKAHPVPTKHSESRPIGKVPLFPPTYQQTSQVYRYQPTTPAQHPLTTYHICRICLRPRSEKFHIQHPIASDGVPPPPSICRRCRVTSVEEKIEIVELEHRGESEKVKLGLKCIIPEDNYASRKERDEEIEHAKGRKWRAEYDKYHHSSTGSSDKPEKVVYRYVRVKETAPETMAAPAQLPAKPQSLAEVSVENLASLNLMNDQASPKREPKESTTKGGVKVKITAVAPPAFSHTAAHKALVGAVGKIDSAKASMSAHSSKSSNSAAKPAAIPSTALPTTAVRPGHTDSEIRFIAREEIERYRHAERKLDAHPDAFTHGRMVPVERKVPVARRIEAESDAAQLKPWEVPPIPPVPTAEHVRVPSVARSRRVSVTSKQSTKACENPQTWCLEPENAPSNPKTVGQPTSWVDAPIPPVPIIGSVRAPSSIRSRRTSVTSRHSAMPSQQAPSEDSRFWYHDPNNASETKPASVWESKFSYQPSSSHSHRAPSIHSHHAPSTHSRAGSRYEGQFEQELEIVVDQEVRQSSLSPPARSERAASVRSREPAGSERSAPGHWKVSSVKSQPWEEQEVIEVVEEVYQEPSQSSHAASERVPSVTSSKRYEHPAASRVQELKQEASQLRQERGTSSVARVGSDVLVDRESSLHTEQEYWGPDGKPVGRMSSIREESHLEASERGSNVRSDQVAEPPHQGYETKTYIVMPSPSHHLGAMKSDDGGAYYQTRVKGVSMQQQPPSKYEPSNKDLDNDSDKTRWPRDEPPNRPAASERTSTVKGDWDYKYTERIVQPAHRPLGSRPFDEGPGRHYTEVEHLTCRGPSISAAQSTPIASRVSETPRRPQEPLRSNLAVPSRRRTPPEARGRGPLMRTSEESVHVRFAGKDDFSPTPPGSDEYLPEHARPEYTGRSNVRRGERRESGARHASGLRKELDGAAERPEQLFAAYESNRVDGRGGEQRDFVFERRSDRGHDRYDGQTEMHGALRYEPSHRFQQPDRHHTSLRGGGDSGPDGAFRDHDQETATQLSKSKPLARALSESPSREKMRRDYMGTERERSLSRPCFAGRYAPRGRPGDRVDGDPGFEGRRRERRTESMDPGVRSGHGGPSARKDGPGRHHHHHRPSAQFRHGHGELGREHQHDKHDTHGAHGRNGGDFAEMLGEMMEHIGETL